MRDGYGFPATLLGKRFAGIMSGTLAMSARGHYLHNATYENWYLWLVDFYVPNTIQPRE